MHKGVFSENILQRGVRPGGQQQPDQFEVAALRRVHQCGLPENVAGVDPGTRLQKLSGDRLALFKICCRHQRRSSAVFRSDIDRHTAFEQQFSALRIFPGPWAILCKA